ncbi:MAG TPA: hypothetical protein DDY78_24390 [Planctomycetales bacterium]|jgi:hypothetical protein|nr:hypothetical protein [Planctomycetales bacterium]
MGAGTVFPEAVMEAAGTFAATLESASEEWLADDWDEETSDAVSLIRVLRKNLQHFPRDMKQFLSRGVETSQFMKRWQPVLDRHGDTSAGVLKIVEAIRAQRSAPRGSMLLSELKGMGEDMGAAMDFLRDLLAQLTARRPIDWTRVEAAQKAFERGETKPFHGLTGA